MPKTKSKKKPRCKNASGFIGVACIHRDYQISGYRAQIYGTGKIAGEQKIIGTYRTAKEAAKAYDAAAIEHGKPKSKMNFPSLVPRGYKPKAEDLPPRNTSGYRGVTKHTEKKFQARLSINGKQQHLGFFSKLKEAAMAYDRAVHKYGQPATWLNFPNRKLPASSSFPSFPSSSSSSSSSSFSSSSSSASLTTAAASAATGTTTAQIMSTEQFNKHWAATNRNIKQMIKTCRQNQIQISQLEQTLADNQTTLKSLIANKEALLKIIKNTEVATCKN